MQPRIGIIAAILLILGAVLANIDTPVRHQEVPYVPVTFVFDGDTIEVELQDGTRERVRYIGIDTPEGQREDEAAECYSKEARDANRALVEGMEVQLVPDDEDRDAFGRLLRYVYTEDTFVNMKLMEDGFAEALTIPPNTRFADVFEQVEEIAREQERGLWSACE